MRAVRGRGRGGRLPAPGDWERLGWRVDGEVQAHSLALICVLFRQIGDLLTEESYGRERFCKLMRKV